MTASVAVKKQKETALINEYGTLVKRIAYHVSTKMPAHVQTDDLIQAGMMGLLEAADRFSEDKGASFSTYAGIRIRGAMLDEVRRTDWVPRSVHRDNRKIQDATRAVEGKIGRGAKDTEIAAQMQIDIGSYRRILNNSHSTSVHGLDDVGLSEDRIEAGITSVAIEPYKELYESKFQTTLLENIGKLPGKERRVIELYYTSEYNLRQIGEELGVTESRVCQIHAQAVQRLKSMMKEW